VGLTYLAVMGWPEMDSKASDSNNFGALDSIIEAEAKVKEITEAANKKKQEIIENAKRGMASLLEEAKKNSLQLREKQILAMKKALEKEKEKLAEQNKNFIGQLKQKARVHSKKETDFLVEKFLKESLDA
jgi:vacuolar-type H+-ATPase subunit H